MSKLCLMLLHTGAIDLADCATPLLHALTANAMQAEVEVYFIGRCVRLLANDTAHHILAPVTRKPLKGLLDDAKESGVRLFACTSAWKAHADPTATLTVQSAGFAGAATYIARALDSSWRVLSY